VEVFHQGVWGTICDDDFTRENAEVICRQVGLVTTYPFFATDSSYVSTPIWLDDVSCIGNEVSVSDCTHADWGVNNCATSENVMVFCSNYGCTCEHEMVESCPALHNRIGDWCDDSCCGDFGDCCKLSGGGILVTVLSVVIGLAVITVIVVRCAKKRRAARLNPESVRAVLVTVPVNLDVDSMTADQTTCGTQSIEIASLKSDNSGPTAMPTSAPTPVTASTKSSVVPLSEGRSEVTVLVRSLSNESSEFDREALALTLLRSFTSITLSDARHVMAHFSMMGSKKPVLVALRRLLSVQDWETLLTETVSSEFQRGLVREA
jgi:hypothetical protein